MDWIRGCPLRKLLAIIVTAVWVSVALAKLVTDTDIPPNVYNLLWSMCGAVYTGYFGSSAYECGKQIQTHVNANEAPGSQNAQNGGQPDE